MNKDLNTAWNCRNNELRQRWGKIKHSLWFWFSFPHWLFCLCESHFLISSFARSSTNNQSPVAVEEAMTRPGNPKQVRRWRRVFKHVYSPCWTVLLVICPIVSSGNSYKLLIWRLKNERKKQSILFSHLLLDSGLGKAHWHRLMPSPELGDGLGYTSEWRRHQLLVREGSVWSGPLRVAEILV